MEIGSLRNNYDSKLNILLKTSPSLEKEIFGGSLKDFKILNELGRGSFGTVYKAESLLNNKECVLKKIEINNLKHKHRKDAIKEVQILKKVRHENIIKYYNSFCEDNCLYIVMEYAAGGDLQKQINNNKNLKQSFSEKEIWDFASQISQALMYLHSHKIIHRDIKTLNIFLDKNKKIKLGDLGVSKIVANPLAINGTRVGTPLYLAPELVKHQPYDNKIDIWAFGCVLYYLAALEPPFSGENLISLGYNIVNRIPKSLPNAYSETLWKFIMVLLEKDNDKRKNLNEIVELIPNSLTKINESQVQKINIQVKAKEENPIKMNELKSPQNKNVNTNEGKTQNFKINDELKNLTETSIKETVNIQKPHEIPLEKIQLEKKLEKQEENNISSFEIIELKEDKEAITLRENYDELNKKNEPNTNKQQQDLEKPKRSPQKFKIRPFSANIIISNKQKEIKEKTPLTAAVHDIITPKVVKEFPNNFVLPQKQNNALFRPRSAIVQKQTAITKSTNVIASSKLVNNFVKNEEIDLKKENNITVNSSENRRMLERFQLNEKNGKVCPEIKDILTYQNHNMHSVYYESNYQNNLNSNFFFQLFGVQKPLVEKNTKFQVNISDNSSTCRITNTMKKKEDFSETTQRIVQPKICVKKREECLNRKAISSLNFFQQCSQPDRLEKAEKHLMLNQNIKEKNPLTVLLSQQKIKKKYSIKDLIDE